MADPKTRLQAANRLVYANQEEAQVARLQELLLELNSARERLCVCTCYVHINPFSSPWC